MYVHLCTYMYLSFWVMRTYVVCYGMFALPGFIYFSIPASPRLTQANEALLILGVVFCFGAIVVSAVIICLVGKRKCLGKLGTSL